MKKFFSLFLAVMLLAGCFSANAWAEETIYPKVTHSYISTEDFASDEWSTAQRGAYLLSGTSAISRPDNTHINISGNTNGTQTCDKIILVLYVEQSESYATGYYTYKTYAYSAENVYQLTKAISNIKVDRGYYYRVTGVHSVTENGITETTNSVTNPIDYR